MREWQFFLIFLIIFSSVSVSAAKEAKDLSHIQQLKESPSDYVEVIVTFKESSDFNLGKKGYSAKANAVAQEKVSSLNKDFSESRFSAQGNIIPGALAKVKKSDLDSLANHPLIDTIEPNVMYHSMLATSVDHINASELWNISMGGSFLNGTGQTVCVVDTGIYAAHNTFGSCSIVQHTLTGNVEPYSLESAHPYANNQEYNFTIRKGNYTSLAVYFTQMAIEPRYDYVKIYDSDYNLVATYENNRSNFWSVSVPGDTMHINFSTDTFITDFGFVINATLNGTSNTTVNWSACPKILDGYDVVYSDNNPDDEESHGTHVAGTIVGINETYKGVAPGARVIIARSLDNNGSGTAAEINNGIEWCIGQRDKYNVSVISMSLGGSTNFSRPCDSNSSIGNVRTTKLINYAVANNISVIAAAGNNGNKQHIGSPACISNATAVGALTKADATTAYSQAGVLLDFWAPGSSIVSSVLNNNFGTKSGTSMATPHVSGAYALLSQFGKIVFNRTLTPFEIYEALNNTGVAVVDTGVSRQRIDIFEAYQYLDSVAPTLTFVSPTTSNYSKNANLTHFFNITSSESLASAVLRINGVSVGLNNSGLVWWRNHTFTVNTTYNISFTGIDFANNSNTIEHTLIVNQLSLYGTIPSANVSVAEPNNVSFFVNVSNPENENYTVYWYRNGTLDASGVNLSNYTYLSNYSSSGWYEILAVVDDNHTNVTFTWNLTVNNTNRLPIVNWTEPSLGNISIIEPGIINFNTSVYDNDTETDGQILNYTWFVNGANISADDNYTIGGNYSSSGIFNITLVVKDGIDNISINWNLTINNTDLTPNITSFSPANLNFTNQHNTSIYFNHTSNDTDGDYVYYYWYDNGTYQSNLSYYNVSLNTSGWHNITLIVNDSQGNFDNQTWWVNINNPPLLVLVDQNLSEGDLFNYTLNISDADNDAFNVSINSSNITLSGLNLLWSTGNFSGEYRINVSYNDSIYNSSEILLINVSPVNDAPQFNGTIPNQTWAEDTANSYAFNVYDFFTDIDNSTLIFSTRGNSSITITVNGSGNVSFTQPANYFGTEVINFTASDGEYNVTSHMIWLIVTDVAESSNTNNNNGGGGGGGGSSFSLPTTASSTSNANIETTKAKAWAEIGKGQTKTMQVEDLSINTITFAPSEVSSNAKLTVNKLKSAPSTTGEANNALEYFEIKIENANVVNPVISFQVNKSTLENNSIRKQDVVLYRYNNSWVQLDTVLLTETNGVFLYEAISPGFSYFAIGAKDYVPEEVDEVDLSDAEQEVTQVKESNTISVPETLPAINDSESIGDETPDTGFKLPWQPFVIVFVVILAGVVFAKRNMIKLGIAMKTHEVNKPHDYHDKLAGFIEKQIQKGYTKEQIAKALVKKGWPEHVVRDEMLKVK